MFTRLKSQREREQQRERDPYARRKHPRPPMLKLPRSNSINYIPSKIGRIEEDIATGLIWSVIARRGRKRLHREDMYTVIPFITQFYQPLSIFAIFDGHGGKRAAEFASKRLPNLFLDRFRQSGNVNDSLVFAFLKTDDEVIDEFGKEDNSGASFVRKASLFSRRASRSPAHRRSREDKMKSPRGEGVIDGMRMMKSRDGDGKGNKACGCTATVVAMVGRSISIAHVGDSRAVLCTENGVQRLFEDHRPGRPDEQRRIESSGGLILDISGTPRVNGVLAVSRSIGDAELKEFVIARPEVTEILLKGDEEFLVLATDGLWDVVSDDEVMKLVREVLYNKGSEEEAVKKLVERAWESGSTDDTCVMVINLIKYGNIGMGDVVEASEFLSPDGIGPQGEFVTSARTEREQRGGGVQDAGPPLRQSGEMAVEMVTPHAQVAPTPRARKKSGW